MTTYTEEACPYKDDCPYPYHNHPRIKPLTEIEKSFAIADILVQYCHDHVSRRPEAITAMAKLINSQVIAALEELERSTFKVNVSDGTATAIIPTAIQTLKERYQ